MKSGDEADGKLIYGLHTVGEVLRARPGEVERIYALREKRAGLGRVLKAGRLAGIPVTYLDRELLARKLGGRVVHQGVAALVSPVRYQDADEICRLAGERPAGLLVLLDGVVDPRNVGAIVRSCAAAGADGVLLGAERTAGLTAAASKAAAGALEKIPVGREPAPSRRLAALGKGGFKVIGLDPRGGRPWDRTDLTGPLVLVAGGEERGLRPGVADACHAKVAIPLEAGIESLNVGVALGVVLFEAVRQRRSGGAPSGSP